MQYDVVWLLGNADANTSWYQPVLPLCNQIYLQGLTLKAYTNIMQL